ncbi:MAG: hypothetical protein GXO37_06785, partial [Chloroflexi bacterium]|nr:hypothetical protein [Chloroflexota bacterium]
MRRHLGGLWNSWWGRGLIFSVVIALLMAVLDPLFALRPPGPRPPRRVTATPTRPRPT